jgi:hypothetical protein
MQAKIVFQEDDSLIIEWNNNGEFGRIKLDWIHELQRYVIDAENIGIAKLLQIFKAIDIPLEGQRIYYKQPDNDDDIYTVEDWEKTVAEGWINNDDGCGYWMKNNLISNDEVFSTEQLDATHVVWYNK